MDESARIRREVKAAIAAELKEEALLIRQDKLNDIESLKREAILRKGIYLQEKAKIKAAEDRIKKEAKLNKELVRRQALRYGPLESEIEQHVCTHAKELGCLVYKMTSPAHIGVPDRLFITPTGRVFFIEFKREGGVLTESQKREHAKIFANKGFVFVVKDKLKGEGIINLMVHGDWVNK